MQKNWNIYIIHLFIYTLQAKSLGFVHSRVKARVQTSASGSATMQLIAHAPGSTAQSTVTINVRSGSASATCSAHEPPKKKQVRKRALHQALCFFFLLGTPQSCEVIDLFMMYAKLYGLMCTVCQN